MDYFNTHKNTLFNLITRIINKSVEGEKLDIEYIKKLIKDTKLADEDFIKGLLNDSDNPFNIITDDFKPVFTDDSIRINPTILEKRWLKSIINLKIVELFLDKDIIDRLSENLSDVSPLCYIDLPDCNIDKDVMKTIIYAFRNNSIVIYSSVNKYGEVFENQIGIPFKINYSMFDYKFRLSIFLVKEKRLIYINMENIKSMEIKKIKEIDDELKRLGRKKFFLNYLKDETRSVKLEIYQGKNILERVHLLFATYNKTTYSENAKQFITISYYRFDEEEIIRNILKLGTLVKIKEPKYMQNKILNRLKKGYKLSSLDKVYADD